MSRSPAARRLARRSPCRGAGGRRCSRWSSALVCAAAATARPARHGRARSCPPPRSPTCTSRPTRDRARGRALRARSPAALPPRARGCATQLAARGRARRRSTSRATCGRGSATSSPTRRVAPADSLVLAAVADRPRAEALVARVGNLDAARARTAACQLLDRGHDRARLRRRLPRGRAPSRPCARRSTASRGEGDRARRRGAVPACDCAGAPAGRSLDAYATADGRARGARAARAALLGAARARCSTGRG